MKLKESGIEWLGKIPEHWEIVKIKYIFHETSIKNRGKEEPLAATQIYGVIPKKLYPVRTVEAITSDLNNFKFVKNGDFVISLRSFEGGIEYSKYQGIISPAYTVLEPVINISSLYFQFFFKSSLFISAINLYKTGIREGQNISYSELQQDCLPIPPFSEQQSIANYLDKKCAEIELLIAKKERMITLLREKKESLINEVVTKGLDKTVQLKESNVKWLGRIPAHWEVRRLKYLFSIGSGLNITKSDFTPYGIPCVNYGEIHSEPSRKINLVTHKLPYIDVSYFEHNSKSLVSKGDFVFADTSEDIEGVGNFINIQSNEQIFAGYHTIVLKLNTDKIHYGYYLFLFDSMWVRHQIRKEVCGVKVFSITKTILKEILCIIPPFSEQQAIAQYLDEQCEAIDRTIMKIEDQIKLLKEYKTSLINEAVCGRIDMEV